MHWGHAVSDDLINWEELPLAIAPDMPYENASGCMSGSAIEADGKIWIFYNSVSSAEETVSVAWSEDGVNFTKADSNPVTLQGGREVLGGDSQSVAIDLGTQDPAGGFAIDGNQGQDVVDGHFAIESHVENGRREVGGDSFILVYRILAENGGRRIGRIEGRQLLLGAGKGHEGHDTCGKDRQYFLHIKILI